MRLIKVTLAIPKVDDPRLGRANPNPMGVANQNANVWINPDEIVSVQQTSKHDRYMILLKNGLTMPCEGEADALAQQINTDVTDFRGKLQ